MWALPFVCPVCCLPNLSCSVSAQQDVSATPHSFCSLFADLYHSVSAYQVVSTVLHLSHFLPADTSLMLSLLTSLWVPPSFILFTLLSLCLHLPGCECYPLGPWCLIHCLLTSLLLCFYSPACECHSSFILFTACWPLSLLASVWVLPFVYFNACWPDIFHSVSAH